MMIELTRHVRDAARPTFGTLAIGGSTLRTIEPPWRDNKRNVSCIPTGTYPVAATVHNGLFALRITGVPGRSGILIHVGNTAGDTRGCICPGMTYGDGLYVVRSTEAMAHIVYLWMTHQPTHITITEDLV